ncbi:MAG: hypothetical protein AAF686_05370, partial [Pseudomonadota bacterium]
GATWQERSEIAKIFEDDRFRELARRLVFRHAPESLSEGDRSALRAWNSNRLHGREGVEAGRTVTAALEEVEKLFSDLGETQELSQIRAWLLDLM